MKKSWLLSIIFLIACVAIAVMPLFSPGFLPTHDGEYHLIRFFEFEKMLKSGYWFPRWAPDLNSSYGVPLFNFNYPLPNYWGVLFHKLGYSLVDSFKLTLATGYLASVIFCFFWLSKIFPRKVAAAASIIFAFVPYWFVDIYIRGSVGEVLAISFLMLSFAAIERDLGWILAVAVGLVVLSHNILAMIFLPIISVYTLIAKPKYWWTILIGLSLSAYFWVPALAEQKYVVGLNTVNYQDYFASLAQLLVPSWGSSFFGSRDLGNEMSVQIGMIPLTLIVTGVFFAVKEKVSKANLKLLYFLGIALASIFLMLKSSAFFWAVIPLLSFIQYPWRFLSVILPVSAFLAAYIFTKVKKVWFMYAVTLFAIILAYAYSRPVEYQPRSDQYYLSKLNFTDGTNSLGNTFSTIWSPWKQVRPESRAEFVTGSGQIDFLMEKPLNYQFSVYANTESTLKLNVLYYPGWTVSADGQNQAIDYKNDGTIIFSVNKGNHLIKAMFKETPVRLAAELVSVLSLFCLISWAILKKWK